ncbi:MAG: cytochrome c3 family protein [Ignavibacteriae bacterium]|nr:cytochrome c3 family protein [Ignavibacteriota bacterium]
MKNRLDIILLIACLLVGLSESQAQDFFTLLYPRENPRVSKVRTVSVIGRSDSKDIARIRLLTPARASIWLRMSTKEDKDGFASAVKALFPERFLLSKAVFTMLYPQANKENRQELTFALESNTGLKEFWASEQFKNIYASLFRHSIASVRVEIEGWTAEITETGNASSHIASTGIFVLPTTLTPGSNSLVLQGLDEKGKVLQSAEAVFFVPTEFLPIPSSVGEIPYFHSTVYSETCADCHAIDIPASAAGGGSSMKEYCGPCHAPMVTRKNAHAPVTDWDCLTCHDAAAKQPFALHANKDFGTAVCGECHGDATEAVEKSETQHFPATDRCMQCHDPHGTDERALLVDKVNTICASCHAEMAKTPHPIANHPLTTVERPSTQVRRLDCASCHLPHASALPKLVRGTGMALCSTCHDY